MVPDGEPGGFRHFWVSSSFTDLFFLRGDVRRVLERDLFAEEIVPFP